MAATLTREQMFAAILEQDAARHDVVADTRSMSVSIEQGTLMLDVSSGDPMDRQFGITSQFALNSYATGQIAGDLNIPKRYFDRMLVDAPGLLVSNVEHWLHEEPNRRLVRGFSRGAGMVSTGRAWLSDRYRRLDNIEIARRVFPVFEEIEGLRFHQAALTDTRFHVRALLPGYEADIGTVRDNTGREVGDVVQLGVEIRNSEVGSGALVVQPFILRLICTNGMTVQDGAVRKHHIGKRIEDENQFSDEALEADDNAFWLVVRDTVKSTLTEVRFNEIVGKLRETRTGQKVEAPIAATETLQSRYSLTDEEREQVLNNLISGGDTSQWGLLNAVTATAKESDDFDRQAELEALGWTIGSLRGSDWNNIAVA